MAAGAPDVCMFRGYVDHGQVLTTVRRRQPSRLLSALMPAGISAPPQRPAASAGAAHTDGDGATDPSQPRPPSYFIRMTGPRGRGRAEVAVSSRASPRPAPPRSTLHTAKSEAAHRPMPTLTPPHIPKLQQVPRTARAVTSRTPQKQGASLQTRARVWRTGPAARTRRGTVAGASGGCSGAFRARRRRSAGPSWGRLRGLLLGRPRSRCRHSLSAASSASC